jgi:hypothetical protein
MAESMTSGLQLTDLPVVTPYDPMPAREEARRRIAYSLMGLLYLTFLGTSVLIVGFKLAQETIREMFTALVGLTGTMLGFYFGGQASQPRQNS